MPHSEQAKKRVRQTAKRNLRNRMVKSEIKTFMKKVEDAVAAGNRALAEEHLRATQARLDRAVRKGVMHKNTVDRRKSLLHRTLAALPA